MTTFKQHLQTLQSWLYLLGSVGLIIVTALGLLFLACDFYMKAKEKMSFYDSFMTECAKENTTNQCKSKLLLGGKVLIEPMPSSAFEPNQKGK